MHFPPSNLASAPQFGGFSHKIPKVVLDQDQGCQGSADGSRHQKPHKQTDYNPDESDSPLVREACSSRPHRRQAL
ncbi:hypothetical protein NKJ06_02375 [Mesorhizobium sp. M0293]|uniref:hypothetical protein n=1 Tax=Mesorhizobium sp. M0293 TaxID=2956930 RepID=UPI0033378805